jgi:geranylgeranyl pyrophosphate synthase
MNGASAPTQRVDSTSGIKSESDIAFLRALIEDCGSIDYAWAVAQRYARRFERDLQIVFKAWPPSIHKDFLHHLADFTIRRTH